MNRLTATVAVTVSGLALLLTPGCRLPGEGGGETSGGAGGAGGHDGCGTSFCDGDRYCEGAACFDAGAPISIVMCQCSLLDPACGIGTCAGDSYTTGHNCPSPVTYPATSPISEALCGGVAMNPKSCCTHECKPYDTSTTQGNDDDFLTTDGAEPSLPSAGLTSFIGSVYWNHSVRNFDEIHSNEWFGTTFTGLAPNPGMYICAANLSGRFGFGDELNYNDDLGLFFVDNDGNSPTFGQQIGSPGWGAPLTTWLGGGTEATFSIDIGTLTSTADPMLGVDMLTQMENGWLDFFMQDDTAVDFLTLDVKYCCGSRPLPLPGPTNGLAGAPGKPSAGASSTP